MQITQEIEVPADVRYLSMQFLASGVWMHCIGDSPDGFIWGGIDLKKRVVKPVGKNTRFVTDERGSVYFPTKDSQLHVSLNVKETIS